MYIYIPVHTEMAQERIISKGTEEENEQRAATANRKPVPTDRRKCTIETEQQKSPGSPERLHWPRLQSYIRKTAGPLHTPFLFRLPRIA